MSTDEIREIAQACEKNSAFISPDKVLQIIWTLENEPVSPFHITHHYEMERPDGR